MAFRRACFAACLILASPALTGTLHAPEARAQSVSPAIEKLYNEAVAEMAAKKYAAACPKLEEVTRQVPEGLGAKVTLGECYEAFGKLGSAYSVYVKVLRAAERASNGERGKEASGKIAALAPRVARLTLSVPAATRALPGFSLTLDGAPVPVAELGAASPIDMGSHEIKASATGRKAWSTRTEIAKDGASVTVEVPLLEAEAPSVVPGAPATNVPIADLPPVKPAATRETWRVALGTTGLLTGSFSLALGVVSSLQVSSAQSTLDTVRGSLKFGEDACVIVGNDPGRFAEPSKIQDACSKSAFVPLQYVFYGLSALLAGAGIYFLATSKVAAPPQKAHFSVAPVAGADYGGVLARGTW